MDAKIIFNNVLVKGDLDSNKSEAQIISDMLLPSTAIIQEFLDTDAKAADWVLVVSNGSNLKRITKTIVWNAATNVVTDTEDSNIVELGDTLIITFDAVIEDVAGTDYLRLKATVPANTGTWDIILFRELY